MPPARIALGLAFAGTAALWWLYFDYVAPIAQRRLALAPNRTLLARDGYTYLHVLMIAGIIAWAVGDELVIAHPTDELPTAEVVVLVSGPAIYLLGHVLFRLRMAGTLSWKRLAGALACLAVGGLGPVAPGLVLSGLLVAVARRRDRRGADRRSATSCPRRAVSTSAAGIQLGKRILSAMKEGSLKLVPLVLAVAAAAVLATTGISAPRDTSFPGGSYFAILCSFSHRNNDDPIVHPGAPGRSHNHTYIGNTSVHAFSTPETLRGGETTCELPGDASTYWVPTLYVGTEPIIPLAGIVYYIKHTYQRVESLPEGLKMVTGNALAKKAQSKIVGAWSCGGIGGKLRFSVLPQCRVDQALELRLHFPNCWNGKTLDSPDHKRHMAYSVNGACPQSHPVAVPTVALILIYDSVPKRARLASGKFGLHADFMNGWDEDVLARLVAGLNYG